MSNDWGRSRLAHIGEPLIHLGGNAEIAELDEQIAAVADAVPRGVLQGTLHVFEREMKVATQAEFWPIAYSTLEFLQQIREIFTIIEIAVVRMRSGHHVLDPIRGSHAAHGLGGFP